MSLGTPKKCRLLKTSLRLDLVNNDVINLVKSCWTDPSCDSSQLESLGVEIVRDPFPVCIIDNFISSPDLLKFVVQEVKKIRFDEKRNDLYYFYQSEDVQHLKIYSFIPELYRLLKDEGLEWVNKTLGNNQLKQEISATFSVYTDQNRLLCHDDKCEDRHIAFILYLVEDWKEEDGGLLQLFNTDDHEYPNEIVRNIIPKFNTMVLFEVTHESFHQVSEVTSKNKERISINGWFHSSVKKSTKKKIKTLDCIQTPGNDKEFKFEDYLSSIYYDDYFKNEIKERFLENSEIQLDNFFNPKIWEAVVNDIRSSDIRWSFKGPANVRKYEVAEPSSLPDSIRLLKDLFESKCWFNYLRHVTKLDLAPTEASDMQIWERGTQPDCTCEVQRWTHSCYTLIHDRDSQFYRRGLDMILRLPFHADQNYDKNEEDDLPDSGHVVYIDAISQEEEEECLLHIGYKMNSLSLVFRDKKTLRFIDYLNSAAEPFYQIFCVYRTWKSPGGLPKLKHCDSDSDSGTMSKESEDSNEDENLLE